MVRNLDMVKFRVTNCQLPFLVRPLEFGYSLIPTIPCKTIVFCTPNYQQCEICTRFSISSSGMRIADNNPWLSRCIHSKAVTVDDSFLHDF